MQHELVVGRHAGGRTACDTTAVFFRDAIKLALVAANGGRQNVTARQACRLREL